MKAQKLFCFGAILLLAILPIMAQTLTQQNPAGDKHRHHHYKLIDLGTFGGPQSYVSIPPSSYAPVLNNRGDLSGWADTPNKDPYPDFCFNEDCYTSHTFVWRAGQMTDLGTLPSGASSASAWISSRGLIAGASENGQIDPLISEPEIRAVLWQEGGITDLGTLEGGYESAANAVNNQGVVVGWSTNTVADPFPGVDGGASVGLGYQTRAFLSQNGAGQDLGTLRTGTDATVYLVNENGQAAGDSFTDQTLNTTATCGTNVPTQDPFFWDKEKGMIDIGTLGGVCGFASGMNSRGQVVGLSDLAGDQKWHAYVWNRHGKIQDLGTFGGSNSSAIAVNDAGHVIGWADLLGDKSLHAFLWRHGKKSDLGTLHKDPCSQSFGLNSHDQVVGISVPGCDFENQSAYSAFLWQDGEGIVDLNALVSHGSDLHLAMPETVNDRGEIAGVGFLANGYEHAFVLIPCDQNHAGVEGCDYSLANSVAAIPESAASVMHELTTTAPRNARGLSSLTHRREIHLPRSPVSDEFDSFQGNPNWEERLVPEKHAMQELDSFKGSRCLRRGSQCLPWIKCCPGLTCVPASTRAYCE
jgi:probable HAF family extracellular repeat protein